MDAQNTFETPATAGLARLEWGALLVTCSVLAVAHIGEIDWAVFVPLFLVIDVVGYLPGMLAHRKRPRGTVAPVYYLLYNVMHSLVTWVLVLGTWVLLAGWQWALLAVPVHLLGDRALFGNSMKPFGVSFEPEKHPVFAEFQHAYAATPALWSGRTDLRAAPATGRRQQVEHAVE